MIKIIKEYDGFENDGSYDCLLVLSNLQIYIGYFDNGVRSYFTTINLKPLSYKDFLQHGLFMCIKRDKIF